MGCSDSISWHMPKSRNQYFHFSFPSTTHGSIHRCVFRPVLKNAEWMLAVCSCHRSIAGSGAVCCIREWMDYSARWRLLWRRHSNSALVISRLIRSSMSFLFVNSFSLIISFFSISIRYIEVVVVAKAHFSSHKS